MASDPIQKILESRRQGGATAAPAEAAESEGDKFFSILVGEAIEEHYLEVRFSTGTRVCLSYGELSWFDYDPEAGVIDLEFGVMMVILEGRGLGAELFEGIKRKRVAWIKEADTEMQDHPGNKTFIKEIRIVLPGAEQNEEGREAEKSTA